TPVGGRRFRGHGVDDPVSDAGWQQMWNAVGDNAPWTRIVTSPMQRCHAFANALQQRNDLPVEVEERFREVGLGRWEGLSADEIMARNEAEYRAFYLDPQRNRPSGSEPLESFGGRVAEALESVFRNCSGEHVLVIAHAGVIRAALGHVLRAEAVAWYRARVDNASFTRFVSGSYGCKLEFHNRTHLPDMRG
ncbi:MAG: histidine phosphatase family protein, partial [Thiogranum sp.]